MGISSLGIGSSILTQDVLDQLREADEAGRIKPIELSITNENDRKNAFNIMEANVTNLSDSIEAISSQLLFDERSAEVVGTSVEVSADTNTDIQDFTLVVDSLATKQIEQSGSFGSLTDLIASDEGTMTFNIETQDLPTTLGTSTLSSDIEVEYDENTTLDDLKDMINEESGGLLNATVVQVTSGDFRLFVSSTETGAKTIVMSDTGNLEEPMDDGLEVVQTGETANFTFNGQDVERHNNMVDDLVTGLDITLKEAGTSVVSITQNRETILEKIDNFVEHYNATITELDKLTKASTNPKDRGIFSTDSIIKSMKRSIEDMMDNISGGVGYMSDYGFEVDKDGVMSVDQTLLSEQFDSDPVNLQAFFSGGTYTKDDESTVELNGAFVEMFSTMDGYSSFNGTLDLFIGDITEKKSTLTERKTTATQRLDAKYEIMKKQYAAYDLMISKINSASSMFLQMANAQSDAEK